MKRLMVTIGTILLVACAGKALTNAQKVNFYMAELYTSVANEWADDFVETYGKIKDGTATPRDLKRFEDLRKMGKLLTSFAHAQHSYDSALQLWKTTGKRPVELDELIVKLNRLAEDLIQLARQLGFKIPVEGGNR